MHTWVWVGVQSAVFAVVFGVLSSGAIILTLNVLLLVSTSLSRLVPHPNISLILSVSKLQFAFWASDWRSGMYSEVPSIAYGWF